MRYGIRDRGRFSFGASSPRGSPVLATLIAVALLAGAVGAQQPAVAGAGAQQGATLVVAKVCDEGVRSIGS